jgi:succinate dehydrogenase/fumarate reductase flavoprotein subunit
MFQFPTRSHTVAAQGGINAALGNMTEGIHYIWASNIVRIASLLTIPR